MSALTNGAAKYIKAELADLFSNTKYAIDRMSQETFSGGQKGDTIEVGSIGSLTVNSDGSSDATAEDPSLSALQLIVDQEPMILTHIKRRYEKQMLGGNGKWSEEIAKQATPQMKNYMDRNLFDYLAWTLCVDGTTGATTYWQNVAGATLTYAHFLAAKGKILGQRGSDQNRLELWLDSFAESAVHNFSGFIPNHQRLEEGHFGARMVGTISGIPVFVSAEVPGSDARGVYGGGAAGSAQGNIATTAVSVTSNVATVTTAAAHGLATGMKVTIAGITTPLTTAAAITVTSATQFTVALTAGDGAMADGVGTVSVALAVNFLVDTGHVHVAQDDDVQVEIVKRQSSTGHNLQVSPLFGRIGRAGRVVCIGSPRAAITG